MFAIESLILGDSLKQLVISLRADANRLQGVSNFPSAAIQRCALRELDHRQDSKLMLTFYVALASGCMTTAFIMTQRQAAIRRLESCDNGIAKERWLAAVLSGEQFATVGISHLTTSRRHLATPPLTATPTTDGWTLDGYTPWVTGAAYADMLVVGAIVAQGCENAGKQMLFAVPTKLAGLRAGPGTELLALTSSCTDAVHFDNVQISTNDWLAGPSDFVMTVGSGGGAGGLQTSALALGLAATAIEYLVEQSQARVDLQSICESFANTWRRLYDTLISTEPFDTSELRKEANDLVLQTTQAAMAAAKGAGFISTHPVSRWCREALFFLVWSCPQSVVDAHLCSFAATDGNWPV